jgi:hypothetical protein
MPVHGRAGGQLPDPIAVTAGSLKPHAANFLARAAALGPAGWLTARTGDVARIDPAGVQFRSGTSKARAFRRKSICSQGKIKPA